MSSIGFSAMAVTMLGFGLAGFDLPLWATIPRVPFIMALSVTLGAEISLVVIPAETLLQEKSPPELRGRVIAVYFLLANVVAIPIMLLVGTAADRLGIPQVVLGVVSFLTVLAAVTTYEAFRLRGSKGGGFEEGTAIEYYSGTKRE